MEILAIPRVLRQKWDDDVVDAVIELINKSNSKLKEDTLSYVEDKFEIRLTEEMAKINQRITEEISKVNQNISESHANLIKWMFIFWCGQIVILVGLFALFK